MFDSAPITAATDASFTGLLNISEKPNTPQKLMASRSKIRAQTGSPSGRKSIGCSRSNSAMSQAVNVATTTIMIA